MRDIINGLIYDTRKSTMIASKNWDERCHRFDASSPGSYPRYAELHMTENKRFFKLIFKSHVSETCVSKGGFCSSARYEYVVNNFTPMEIIPLSREEAMNYLNSCNNKEYSLKEIFGEIEEA